MFKEYLEEVQDSVANAILLLGKKTFIHQFMITLIFTLLSFGVFYSILGAGFFEFIAKIQNKEVSDSREIMEFFKLASGGLALMAVIIVAISSLQYAVSLRFNDIYVREGSNDIGKAFSIGIAKDLLPCLGYSLIYIGIIMLLCLIGGLIFSALIATQNIALMVVVGLIFIVLFTIVFIRIFPGYAFIIHGNQTPFEALKSSISTINIQRAFIIMAIGIGLVIGIGIAQALMGYIFSGLFGSNIIISQIASNLISALTYAFVIAALSSFYFRYNTIGNYSNTEEHLISDL